MSKNKLLLLLALLLTAATGAWAQDAKHLITATYREQTHSLEQPLPYATTIGELYESVTGQSFSDLISSMSAVEMPLTGITSRNTSVVSIGELNGASTPVTVKADGEATISIKFGSYAHGIFVSAISPLYANMKDGVKDADKWTVKVGDGQAQALPIGGLKGDGSETVTLQYTGRLKVKSVKATSEAVPAAGKTVDLSTLTADYEAQNGDVLTGETTSCKVTIAAGATVTLDGVNISKYGYCIKCLGDATIILKDGSTNTLTGTGTEYPALSIGDANTTLTIQGSTGVLNVTSGNYCAGIGGGYSNTNSTCGNIRIEGGVITAQGGHGGSGIGSDCGEATCGDIIITGGTITAKGGSNAAGIGTGNGRISQVVCGNITIANTVTKVTATAGEEAPYSIGKGDGDNATCGTVTIGGTKYWENNAAVNDGATYLAQSPLIYDPSAAAKEPATVTTAPTGAAIVGVGKNTALVSGGAADGGTLMYAVTTTNTKPTSTDGFSADVPTAEDITASGKVYVWYYVKGDDTHSDSEIAATAIEVPVADIVWDITNISSLNISGTGQYEKEGIKLSANAEDVYATWINDGISFSAYQSGGFTFTAPTGKAFTKIEMKALDSDGWATANLGTGWAFNNPTVTWKGSAAASTVGLLTGADNYYSAPVTYIAFYLSEQAAKPAATVTTAPTGAAIVGVGKTTALVSGGVADGGTLMYAVTTTNTKPASTDGFSDKVPTAETITASGKVYVWYYVKGDDTHSDSEIAATAIEVPVADIVWDATNISDLNVWGTDPYVKEGVTLSCNAENISAEWADYGDPATAGIFFAVFDSGGLTFTAPTGKAFTKIEMKAQGPDGWEEANLGTGWAYNNLTVTWKGSAASTDKLLPDTDDFTGAPVKCIGFYLSE